MKINNQLTRFILSGGTVAGIDLSVYSLIVFFSLASADIANVIGMTAGFLSGFALHKAFTFKVKTQQAKLMFFRYGLVFLINLYVAFICLPILAAWTGEAYISKILTMTIVFISNFLLSRYFVFTVTTKENE